MRRRADKPDTNQNEIVDQLRQIPGVSVEVNHDDILVGYRLGTFWFEVKRRGAVSKKTGRIKESCKTKSQKLLDETWTGQRDYVTSFDDIIQIILEAKPK